MGVSLPALREEGNEVMLGKHSEKQVNPHIQIWIYHLSGPFTGCRQPYGRKVAQDLRAKTLPRRQEEQRMALPGESLADEE